MTELPCRSFSAAPQSTGFRSVVELLRWRARRSPDQWAFTSLRDGESEASRLSFSELDREARRIGAELQAAGARGQRALMLYPAGIEFVTAFYGCLYAGTVAIPAYPPDPQRLDRSLARLRVMIEDSRATTILTTTELAAFGTRILSHAHERLRWIATDSPGALDAADWRDPRVDHQSIALLQYTSGSTGEPRGVVLRHGNLLHNLDVISDGFRLRDGEIMVFWLPAYHDMGLIGGVLKPVNPALHVILMSPIDFLKRPLRWLEAISRYGAAISGAPNFAFDLCARRSTPDLRRGLDLSTWRVAFNGAEPIRADTLERFADAFGPAGFRREAFYPCYGLAEATLIVSGGRWDAPPRLRTVARHELEAGRAVEAAAGSPRTVLVGCGRALLDVELRIVDPDRRVPLGPGEIGEIWVRSGSVAAAYWRRPQESRALLQARLADSGDGPFLRTGDLGFLEDGELYVTGRLKDLVIVRGRNLAPPDLEHCAERAHPALRPGSVAVFSLEGEQVALVCELRRGADADFAEVVEAVRVALVSDFGIAPDPMVIVETAAVPKTSSGKLRRRECRARLRAGDLPILHEWTRARAKQGHSAADREGV